MCDLSRNLSNQTNCCFDIKGLLCEKVPKECKLLIVFLRSFFKEFFYWVKGGHISEGWQSILVVAVHIRRSGLHVQG